MVQREAGERLVAGAGSPSYGAVSLRVAYFADAEVLRRVPPTVFWPRPNVESVICRLVPRGTPPVRADEGRLFALIGEAFSQRRKTMRSALRRLGVADLAAAGDVLSACGVERMARPENLTLEQFARIAEAVR
jgi:16S rRNA (adenine1518-N6/adenine1519-N6)-dimethyltransferase